MNGTTYLFVEIRKLLIIGRLAYDSRCLNSVLCVGQEFAGGTGRASEEG